MFHIGVAVLDLDEAAAELTASSGLRWAPVLDRPLRGWMQGKEYVERPARITYSVDGPMHVELIEGPSR
jgi:hypothetical protein